MYNAAMSVDAPVKPKRVKKGRDGGVLAPGGGGGGGWNGDESALLEIAREIAARGGYTFGADFEAEFLSAVGSREIAEDQNHTHQDAIRSVTAVVSRAIDFAGDQKVLDGQTFRMVLRDICPIWPFCR